MSENQNIFIKSCCERISEASLNRFNKHINDNVFIILSAYASTCTDKENEKRAIRLKQIINDAKLSYIPVYGGYTMDDNTFSYEESLVVFPFRYNTKEMITEDELFNIGLELIQFAPGQSEYEFEGERIDVDSFGQESFLFKPQNGDAVFIRKNGEVDKSIKPFSAVTFNDLSSKYFTALNKRNGKKSNKSFVFRECFIRKPSKIPHEMWILNLRGELLNI